MLRTVIFARAPVAGRSKTRLAASIGIDAAAALSAAFLADTIRSVCAIEGLAPELHVADAPDHPFFAMIRARFGLPPPTLQREGDLGARMHHVLDVHAPTLILGSDAPTLPASILRDAIDVVERRVAQLVLAPAADGGYLLIGSSGGTSLRFLAEPGIRWSSAHALADTVRAARNEGLAVAFTPPHYDIDTASDLNLLRTELALNPRLAPATSAALSELQV